MGGGSWLQPKPERSVFLNFGARFGADRARRSLGSAAVSGQWAPGEHRSMLPVRIRGRSRRKITQRRHEVTLSGARLFEQRLGCQCSGLMGSDLQAVCQLEYG